MSSFISRHRFWFLLILAIVVTRIPILGVPFKWLESYFHELSHGLAALITGGKVVSIQLFLNGAGLCTTQGGSRFFISFMGYAGASLWGGAIYALAHSQRKTTRALSLFMLCTLFFSTIFWVRDFLTLFIVSSLFILFYVKWKYPKPVFTWLLQLTALIVLLNSVLSPLYLIDGRALGDGAALANLTLIPEIVWVIIWSVFGIFISFLLSKRKSRI